MRGVFHDGAKSPHPEEPRSGVSKDEGDAGMVMDLRNCLEK